MSADEYISSSVGAPLGNNNAIGNPGGGAPANNSNAIGNSGGGAPEDNTNRKSHGVYCDLEKIDDRAEGEVAEFINQMETVIRERADENSKEVAREIPLRLIRYNRAAQHIQQEGMRLDKGANSMLDTSRRILAQIFQDLQEIGAI
ncbi:hypothetical protein EXE46_08025 [Halorubrum sp. GN11_10-6_MGM]|uniref:hypothetical protein n=1 Tax=Halorubrum sp. GN11_10-6_MGM TaxID=2518112 RepID=UPI0010F7CCE0|nr:hypothetical protein [Halorubrum sp. GN11_10-6_MGM]TKX74639.1 hypothetical protein EXE46_08025 [Halorubrum sp. GN11_10-6_MGM]